MVGVAADARAIKYHARVSAFYCAKVPLLHVTSTPIKRLAYLTVGKNRSASVNASVMTGGTNRRVEKVFNADQTTARTRLPGRHAPVLRSGRRSIIVRIVIPQLSLIDAIFRRSVCATTNCIFIFFNLVAESVAYSRWKKEKIPAPLASMHFKTHPIYPTGKFIF